MVVHHLRGHIHSMLEIRDPPKYLVIHVGANYLGNKKVGYLRNEIKFILRGLLRIMPQTVLVWSQILPRFSWRYSDNFEAMERCRRRLNNCIASFILKTGGCYIRHPELTHPALFKDDGVHLTDLGNELFLNNIQGAIETFQRSYSLLNMSVTFPDQY